jgi:hypothetical protein
MEKKKLTATKKKKLGYEQKESWSLNKECF